MKKEINTCNLCKKRDKCKQLCSDMIEKLKNKKNNNDMYSDTTVNVYNSFDLSNIVYTYGLSKIEERDTKRVMIAILKKEQKEILYLLSQGYTQKDIAKKLKVSQSNISQKLEAIKRELKDSLVKIMPYIL
ncbi:ArsR family transcriptional regulator [Brachyspira pilosicoli]|uniref:ArsR family transcriptional regulator n=1 Tax=Brachyspira pilosicoli TaxID=52584 RepID=UPI00242B6403|nr:LuxR C-terminal-related transcriptional regulator [Brachyspira pilosicoli]